MEGEFTININHAVIRSKTLGFRLYDYTKHFIDEYNKLGGKLLLQFPDVRVIGNYEETSKINGFEVYIRGVGPLER